MGRYTCFIFMLCFFSMLSFEKILSAEEGSRPAEKASLPEKNSINSPKGVSTPDKEKINAAKEEKPPISEEEKTLSKKKVSVSEEDVRSEKQKTESPREEKYPGMVYIPAGEFTMGDSTYYNWNFLLAYNIYDGPEHGVYLDDFYIDKYEVTNEQYKKFVDATGYRKPNCWNDSRFNGPNYPVVGVTWEDAVAFSNWAEKRLPTEAEWEKAARGTDRRLWPWGNKFDTEICNVWESKIKATKPAGSFEKGKSPFGCYEMAGNAWEWCADYYDQNYYPVSPKKNPLGPETGIQRVIRGGSFLYFGHYARCAARYRVPWYTQSPQIGFRCAKSVEKKGERETLFPRN